MGTSSLIVIRRPRFQSPLTRALVVGTPSDTFDPLLVWTCLARRSGRDCLVGGVPFGV